MVFKVTRPLLIALVVMALVGCKDKPLAPINPKYKDSEVIKLIENRPVGSPSVHVYFRPGEKFSDGSVWMKREWEVSLDFNGISIEGEGRTLSDAYEDVFKKKADLCK